MNTDELTDSENEQKRIANIKILIDQGLESARNRPLIEVNDESLEKILEKAKNMARSSKQ